MPSNTPLFSEENVPGRYSPAITASAVTYAATRTRILRSMDADGIRINMP